MALEASVALQEEATEDPFARKLIAEIAEQTIRVDEVLAALRAQTESGEESSAKLEREFSEKLERETAGTIGNRGNQCDPSDLRTRADETASDVQ